MSLCKNPFGTKHSKRKSIGQQVVTDQFRNDLVLYFPNIVWLETDILCVTCRSTISKKIRQAKTAENLLHLVQPAEREGGNEQGIPAGGSSVAPPIQQQHQSEDSEIIGDVLGSLINRIEHQEIHQPVAINIDTDEGRPGINEGESGARGSSVPPPIQQQHQSDDSEIMGDVLGSLINRVEHQEIHQPAAINIDIDGRRPEANETPMEEDVPDDTTAYRASCSRRLEFSDEGPRSPAPVEERTSSSISTSSSSKPSSDTASSACSDVMPYEMAEELTKVTSGKFCSPVSLKVVKNQTLLQKKLRSNLQRMRSKYQEVTGLPLDPRQCECKHCDALVTEMGKRCLTLLNKKEIFKLMTCTPSCCTIRRMQTVFNCSYRAAAEAVKLRSTIGPLSFPVYLSRSHPLNPEHVLMAIDFYLDPTNSRVLPGARDTVLVNKEGAKTRVSKQLILVSLQELYTEFKNLHKDVKMGITKFATLRPKQCRWPGQKGHHRTCTCEIHENFKLLASALEGQLEGICTEPTNVDTCEGDENPPQPCSSRSIRNVPTSTNTEDILSQEVNLEDLQILLTNILQDVDAFIQYVICDEPTTLCHLGYCENCPKEESIQPFFNHLRDDNIKFRQWLKTDYVDFVEVEESSEDFEVRFRNAIPKLIHHHFVYRCQKTFFNDLKNHITTTPNTVTLHVDYGQNYSFVVQDAVQAFHWTNTQATIHPFVLHHQHLNEKNELEVTHKTYFVISDEKSHDATVFHIFRDEVMAFIKLDYPNLEKIYYVSDGTGAQYKNFKNIKNLLHHEDDYQIKAEWHFTATAHGKSTCDAMSGVVKRCVRLQSLKENSDPITTPFQMYEVCQTKLSSEKLQFIYVSQERIREKEVKVNKRYEGFKTIPGSRKYHALIPMGVNKLKAQEFSSSSEFVEHQFGPDTTVTEQAPVTYRAGQFLSVKVVHSYQIGMIQEVLDEEGLLRIVMMKKNRNLTFQWITPEKVENFLYTEVLSIVVPPTTITGRIYRLREEDRLAIEAICKRV